MGISCAFYDQLEIAAMRGQKLRLVFQLPKGQTKEIVCQIKDLTVRDGKEYLVTTEKEVFLLEGLNAIELIE